MMNQPMLSCENEQRRHEVRKRHLNGLDYLEVSDDQLCLCVHFIGSLPENITKENLRIEGGQRIQDIRVVDVELEIQEDPTLDSCLRVRVDKFGDFSTYILRLVGLEGIDPRYSYLNFSFKVNCPSDLDCQLAHTCPGEERIEPEINYLAKDYASFHQLILDRLALTMPDWQERHVPDLGITLVEILAYVGDYLSYYQDAVASEAYLDIARQRISVRRHVRLVDYPMHEGCNARTWVWLETNIDTEINLEDIYFITPYQDLPLSNPILRKEDLRNIESNKYEVFEPILTDSQAEIKLYEQHNEIHFYTWGDHQCCLPKGATSATLLDEWVPLAATPKQTPDKCDDDSPPPPPQLERKLKLKVGDILIFEEIKGAKTGNPGDADITHRHAVRITNIQPGIDKVYRVKLNNFEGDMPTPIIEITWAIADALPFPLCISALGLAPECQLIENISVVRGNVVLVDHGRTITGEDLGTVATKAEIMVCEGEGQPTDITLEAAPFYPRLKYAPLTFSQPISTDKDISASLLLNQNPRKSVPQITKLLSNLPSRTKSWNWIPRPDLLGSNSQDRYFVVEMNNEGYAHLRFGNGELGQIPEAGSSFFATYRIGNGIVGNIGADAIAHVVFRQNPPSGLSLIPHNPLPAKGGTQAELLSEVKLFAPSSFRKELQRAIIAQDYADIVMRDFGDRVQRSAATLRWTGSWDEILVVVDPWGKETNSAELLAAISQHLYIYRRIGHDVVVKQAIYVPLDIEMTVCVQPEFLRGHVKAALLDVFSNRILANGQRGFFHPDNLTFGTGIALSKLVAIAQTVTGVDNVVVTKLQRLYEGDNGELDSGILSLNSLEIARLDNDLNFPENGKFKINLRGGR
ncbi:hypothetical protein NIES4101_36420 [Calothrix sp. NIES-4101]|nr:hypothetical protein NIES4101_36420 [Calothrix sp. NIES-4101]